MTSRDKNLIKHFDTMKISVDLESLTEFSNTEKEKLERLARRMEFLYNILLNDKDKVGKESSYQFAKEEFRSLEWVFYEFGIIAEGAEKVKL